MRKMLEGRRSLNNLFAWKSGADQGPICVTHDYFQRQRWLPVPLSFNHSRFTRTLSGENPRRISQEPNENYPYFAIMRLETVSAQGLGVSIANSPEAHSRSILSACRGRSNGDRGTHNAPWYMDPRCLLAFHCIESFTFPARKSGLAC